MKRTLKTFTLATLLSLSTLPEIISEQDVSMGKFSTPNPGTSTNIPYSHTEPQGNLSMGPFTKTGENNKNSYREDTTTEQEKERKERERMEEIWLDVKRTWRGRMPNNTYTTNTPYTTNDAYKEIKPLGDLGMGEFTRKTLSNGTITNISPLIITNRIPYVKPRGNISMESFTDGKKIQKEIGNPDYVIPRGDLSMGSFTNKP